MSERYKIGDELTLDGDAYELSRYDLALTNAAYEAGRQEAQEWQPIETAPKDGRPVVVWRSPWKAPSLAYSLDDNPRTIADDPHGWFECRTHRPIGVTHWLEVVTPPATPNKESE